MNTDPPAHKADFPNPFRYCPQCGSPGGAFLRNHEFRCSVCDHRYFHNVAAAAGVLIRDEDKYLFLIRGMEPSLGLLGLPGGFVDPGEGVSETVRREVREELGAEITPPVFLDGYANRYAFSKIWYNTLDLYFRAEVLTPVAEWKIDPEEVKGFVWKRADEIRDDDLAFPSLRALWYDWTKGRWEKGAQR